MPDRKTRRSSDELCELVARTISRWCATCGHSPVRHYGCKGLCNDLNPSGSGHICACRRYRDARRELLSALQADGLTIGQAKQMAERLIAEARKKSVETP
jgi:hypothetical protein